MLEIHFPRLLLCYYLASYFTLCVICICNSNLVCVYIMCDFVLEHSSAVCVYKSQFYSLLYPQQVNVSVNVLLPVIELRRLSAAKVSTKLYGDDSCPSQPQSQKGIGGLLLEFWIGAGKSSHSCGKLL